MKYTTQTITGENFTVIVHKPILTDGERKKREQEVITALERFGKETEKKSNDKGSGYEKG